MHPDELDATWLRLQDIRARLLTVWQQEQARRMRVQEHTIEPVRRELR
jgi:hypothetical protein